jgi:hypothetical protein
MAEPWERGWYYGANGMSTAAFSATRFKELVLYIAERSADDPSFGSVKLNKLLFFADFEAFRKFGRPITGARYQKLPWGPAAIEFLPVHDELVREERVVVETRSRGTYKQAVTVALTPAKADLFEPAELSLVDDLIERLRGQGAADVSELSHSTSAGWNLVNEREIIPYETVFVSMRKPSERVLDWARDIAHSRRWLHEHP